MENTAPPPVISISNTSLLDFRFTLPLKLIVIALWLILTLPIAPARAQSNPTSESCGLPAGGPDAVIHQTVIYTLTSDCELSGPLYVESAGAPNLRIEGKGFTIRASASDYTSHGNFAGMIWTTNASSSLTLNEVTLDMNGRHAPVVLPTNNLTATKVTFQGLRADGTAQWGNIGTGVSWSLTDVLFRDNDNINSFGAGVAFVVNQSGSLTMNNVAFERNLGGKATIVVEDSPTINASGCLSDVANVPRLIDGASSFRQNRPPCTGKVGNGHDLSTPTATAQSCGFPLGGEIRATVTYTLRSDCRMSSTLYITENVAVTVNGGGKALRGDKDIVIYIGVGGRLVLNNVALYSVRIFNWGHIEGQRLAVYEQRRRFLYVAGTGNINGLLLRDINYPSDSGDNAILVHGGAHRTGTLTITDAIFLNVANARFGTLTAYRPGAAITLKNSVTFINNSPDTTFLIQADSGAITDPDTLPSLESELSYRLSLFPRSSAPARDDGGGSGDDEEEEDASAVKASTASTCLTLDGIAAYNLSESTQCQRVNAMQIANPDIKEGDFVDAVDVWSWVTPNTQICFEAVGGSFKFIDTTAMPRTVHELAAYGLNGMVCATINGPGIVILLPGGPAPPLDTSTAGQSLSGCMVTANTGLNLRMNPGGAVIGGVAEGWTLTAVERTSGWFKVDRLGAMGWISADWVETQGACG